MSAHSVSSFSEAQEDKILRLHTIDGLSQRTLAQRFSVPHTSQIREAIRRSTIRLIQREASRDASAPPPCLLVGEKKPFGLCKREPQGCPPCPVLYTDSVRQ